MAFWIGLYPKPFFQILEQPVNQMCRVTFVSIPPTQCAAAPWRFLLLQWPNPSQRRRKGRTKCPAASHNTLAA